MRICLLTDTLAMGGAERVAVISAVELARLGHAVTLVAYHPQNDFAAALAGTGVQVSPVTGGKISRLRQLRTILQAGRFDLVHAFKAPCLIWGWCSAFGLKAPRWFVGHHALTSESRFVRLLCRLLRPWIRGWIVPSKAAAVVVRRDYLADEGRTHVVPNPIDLARFERRRSAREAKRALNLTEDTAVVTMVANLHPWKDYPFFLRVARRILASQKKVVFLCLGRDLQQGVVQAECRAMGLFDRVHFLGHCSDVAAVLEAADVAVITSPQESFCLALAEAGAMGLPCVSIDNGGASEILVAGQTGFLVPRHDEAAFASQVGRLLLDAALRERMGCAARVWVVERFSPDLVVNRLLQIYGAACPEPHLARPQ